MVKGASIVCLHIVSLELACNNRKEERIFEFFSNHECASFLLLLVFWCLIIGVPSLWIPLKREREREKEHVNCESAITLHSTSGYVDESSHGLFHDNVL